MSDPVDTDALRDLAGAIEEVFRGEPYDANPEAIDEPTLIRAAADEVDRLRRKERNLAGLHRAASRELGSLDAEVDRLRAVIENAPHFPGCEMFTVGGSWKCTCWKADAL